MRFCITLIVLLVVLMSSCSKNTTSNIPFISTLSMYPDSVKAGYFEDTVFISFHFKDGDADLGNDPSGTNYDIYTIDSRDGSITGYFFPSINPSVEDASKGIEGNCLLKLQAALIVPIDTTKQRDTLHYSIFIQDKALHHSDTLVTPNIYIHR